ncbi:hypothetical protein [Polynucleobacter sp. Adler-ghost]|uniref:hypothetical protein n=1 Tax=Polynucleobacter sp. Adler-ghost TaxID=2770234 RepID=UPI001BFE2550|nr:hypothetical protein [Polynucleobacter sp. Adler-ghost]QWE30525.1 hypothetical protein ICV89_09620 [Polynucleobacter sp. Adler-ghost]
MSIFGKKIEYENSWDPIFRKFSFSNGINDSGRVSLTELEFSNSVMSGGFPCELGLKNSFSLVSVYDNELDIKRGDTHIYYYRDDPKRQINVRIVVDKEKFNYLYMISLSSKQISIEFTTPMFSVDKFKELSNGQPLVFQNGTFLIGVRS